MAHRLGQRAAPPPEPPVSSRGGWMGPVGGTRQRVVVVGGGPGGYESALVARQLGADVTVVDRDGLGGACVLTDCVPSKTLIATSDVMSDLGTAGSLGVRFRKGGDAVWDDDDSDTPPDAVGVDPRTVFA